MSGHNEFELSRDFRGEEIIALEHRHGARNYAPLRVVLERGEGVWLIDVDGKYYLDMMSAYSAVNVGHCHPRIVAVARRQLDRVCITSRAFYTTALGPLMRDLTALTGLDAMLPMNTGAEAVETAIKALRRHGYRQLGVPPERAEIIVAQGNFHGRTTTLIGFSSEAAYRADFGPFAPGFITVPFGDANAIEAAMGPNTVGVLMEPIQGEAGVIVPPATFLARVRAICTRRGIPLVLDEIQSGLGRTGKMFCFEHENAQPDGLLVGKALGGGVVPISAFLANRALMDVFEPGSHGSTFGGNPFACEIASETLRVLTEEGLVERSQHRGAELMRLLQAVRHPAIREVRGKGLWIGVELEPDVSAACVCNGMLRRGVLTKETHGTVIRFAPPFVIASSELELAVDAFAKALDEAIPSGKPRRKVARNGPARRRNGKGNKD